MLKHEFGIMPKAPKTGKRYDKYEPQKYDCISVDDAYLQEVTDRLIAIDFYWHTLSVRGRGLAYCGITLIPPRFTESICRCRYRHSPTARVGRAA